MLLLSKHSHFFICDLPLLFCPADIILFVDNVLGNTHNVISVFFISRLLIPVLQHGLPLLVLVSATPGPWKTPIQNCSDYNPQLPKAHLSMVLTSQCFLHQNCTILHLLVFCYLLAGFSQQELQIFQSACKFRIILGCWWQYFLQSFITPTLVTSKIYLL